MKFFFSDIFGETSNKEDEDLTCFCFKMQKVKQDILGQLSRSADGAGFKLV